jgi:hypothetical protein
MHTGTWYGIGAAVLHGVQSIPDGDTGWKRSRDPAGGCEKRLTPGRKERGDFVEIVYKLFQCDGHFGPSHALNGSK